MATATKSNTTSIYRRMANVREQFLAEGIKKTGKNMTLKSRYFDLNDIVPVAQPLFFANGLFPKLDVLQDMCVLSIVDMDDDTKRIDFTAPLEHWQGNAAVTPVQALGANLSYMRRYMYQIALDVVEADEMESGLLPNPTAKTEKPTLPVSEEAREKVKVKLTAPEGDATSLQIQSLKAGLKKLRTAYPDKDTENWISFIAIETSGFTKVSKARCEEIMVQVSDKLEGTENA